MSAQSINSAIKPIATAIDPTIAPEPSAFEWVQHRYSFYRDQYRLLLKIVFTESLLLLILMVLLGVLMTRPLQQRFFATTTDGKLIDLVPLDQPNLTTSAVLSWTSRAVVETLTYGFHDRRLRHQTVRSYFNAEGWASFLKALEDARVIEMVDKQQLVVSAVPEGVPVILEEGIKSGLYFWIIQLPLLVTYQGSGRQSSDHLMLKVRVERSSMLDAGQGLAIRQWIATQGI